MNDIFCLILADFVALKPSAYWGRLITAAAAFAVAVNVDKVVTRVIGFVWLLLTGGAFLVVGFQNGTIGDLLLGGAALTAAGYSWWFTRY